MIISTISILPQAHALLRYTTLFALSGFLFNWSIAQQTASAAINGTVSNVATGRLLEGAVVTIAELGRTELTDNTGRYRFTGVPPGDYTVIASYAGLDADRRTATVTPGGTGTVDFDLTSQVYKMPEFRVTGEREGSAAAITAQRNAPNAKNVVAMDTFGNLPNMSAGEVAMRMPGVAGNLDDEGNVSGLTVRGMGPTLNLLTVDGLLMATPANLSRQFQTHSMTGAMFDTIEVVKGHTPDTSADSLGGTVNLKTHSPLSMKERRRFIYSVGARWAPSFTDQIPLRRDHPIHPLVNLTYMEVVDAFGGERNLGISLNTFYSENVTGYFRTIRDFQNTAAQPAYLWDYRTLDGYNNRKQSSVNLKAEYRLTPAAKFKLNAIYNDAFEPFNRLYEARAFTAQTIATLDISGNPTGTGAILPGFTDTITRVRGVAASTVSITKTMFSFFNRTRGVAFGGEHDLGRLRLDYNAAYSQAHVNLGVGGGGTLTNSVTGVGWILDRTGSDLYPRFTQTEGPNIANIANYRPGQLTARDNKRISEVTDFRGNALYELPTAFPMTLKAGFQWREQISGTTNNDRRWNYLGGATPLEQINLKTWDFMKTGRQLPYFETTALIRNYQPVNPSLWQEDLYFAESQKYSGNRSAQETVAAGYLMTQGKYRQLGFLAGVRLERTEVEATGYVRSRTLTTTAQRNADPVGSARLDFARNFRRNTRDYDNSFPSIHLTYDITPQLKAKVSWSSSIGRPPFSNLVPSETPNEGAQTITINDPGLRPQYAENWDAALEYYFEPVGHVAVGWFRKDIRDYILSNVDVGTVGTGPDNGFNGDYAGFTILANSNFGGAEVEGWELSYQQQLTFLPGWLKGFAFLANYTRLSTEGNFGTTQNLSTNQVAGFIPETGNASLSYRYGRMGVRLLVSYTGEHISSFNAASPARNEYRSSRTLTHLGFSYNWRPEVSFFCDVNNLFNEPQRLYRHIPSQMSRTNITGTTINFGVSGRF